MKNRFIFTAVCALFLQTAIAQAPEKPIRFFGGYKNLNISNLVFTHDTHPDDWFLPDADKPGSAGTTEVNRFVHFLTFGFGYQPRLSDSFSFVFDLGLIVGDTINGKKNMRINDNEIRPDDGYYRPSFIYSKKPRIGGFVSADFLFHVNRIFMGVEYQIAGVVVEKGWHRYHYKHLSNKNYNLKYDDQTDQRKISLLPMYGLKLGYVIAENGAIEASVLYNRSVSLGIQLSINFGH